MNAEPESVCPGMRTPSVGHCHRAFISSIQDPALCLGLLSHTTGPCANQSTNRQNCGLLCHKFPLKIPYFFNLYVHHCALKFGFTLFCKPCSSYPTSSCIYVFLCTHMHLLTNFSHQYINNILIIKFRDSLYFT